MIRNHSFKDQTFQIYCEERYPLHPTWYTFEDEQDVRNKFWNIQTGEKILDIGACFGSYTLTALSQGAAFVWAWAPQGPIGEETEFEILSRNLELNGWSDKCKIYQTGLYAAAGYLNVDNQTFSETRSGSEIYVERLDDWADRELSGAVIDWIKMDVEGAEVEILQNSKNLITRCHPKILVENHVFRRSTIVDEIRQLLLMDIGGYMEVATDLYHVSNVSHSLYVPIVK
jgi:FkbM family methyltransferase